jgi:hypothetical protein
MNKILIATAAVCTVLFPFLIYVQAQLITCRYFAGCSVDRASSTCNLVLDRVSCTTDNILAFTPDCWPNECKTDCDCQCSDSSVNTGKHGQISFFDPCFDSSGSSSTSATTAVIHTQHLHRHRHQLQLLRPVLQMVLLVMGILTAVAVYVISLMGFALQTLPVRADVQVAQK